MGKVEKLPLRIFQVTDIFGNESVEELLRQPRWLETHPEVIHIWNGQDKLASSRVLIPWDMLLAITCECNGAPHFCESADAQTLYMGSASDNRMHLVKDEKNHYIMDENGQYIYKEVPGAKDITIDYALIEYGADALWIAS